jgi:mRNA interferase MazF
MKRGDIIVGAFGSGFGSKPRPALVIQSDRYATFDTLLVTLITSDLARSHVTRPQIEPSPENGLRLRSEIMVNMVLTLRRDQVDKVIGCLSAADIARVDSALMLILGFAE